MKLRKKLHDKFSIVLALAVIFIALPAIGAAQAEAGKIAFDSNRDSNNEIYLMNPDGSQQANLTNNPAFDGQASLSADGGVLAMTQSGATASAPRHSSGINVLMGDGSVRTIKYISLPNSPLEYSSVEANDPNAESKARALFDAAYRLRRSLFITLASGTKVVSGRYPAVDVFINDGGDTSALEIELENCLVSSFQVSGGGGAALESLSINFTKIEYKNVPLH
jgi:prepilin-type processing-associated H-X9-DG protein